MRAVLCPVCDGKGKINDPLTVAATSTVKVVCHGCQGRGWVEVSD